MVLSNKKLKQKLREALAQKAVAAVGTPITQTQTTTGGSKVPAKKLPLNSKEVNGETSADIQGLLDSAAKGRQSLSKREKRRKLRELSNVGGIKGAKQDATPSQTNKEQSLEDERNKQKKRKLEKDKTKGVLVENKGTHLENGHGEGSESNKKRKKRKGEDKDTQIEDKGTLMQEREDDKGTHLENGHSESRKSKTKKKKEGKKEGKDSQMKDEGNRLENGNGGDIKSKKKKGKGKVKIKSQQGASDGLTLSSVADAAEDIVINANEGTLPQSQESNYDECKVYVGEFLITQMKMTYGASLKGVAPLPKWIA